MNWSPERPFQALCLSGGGYKGLFTTSALQSLEQQVGTPLGRNFDLTCGTSIGGIIALALAFEIPVSRVMSVFEDWGERIFPPATASAGQTKIGRAADLIRYLKRPRYDASVLRAAIEAILGRDTILGDALHAVAIPAVNVTQGAPQVFKTRHHANFTRDWRLKVVDIAMATAAAPTYFRLASVDGHLYADGGLFANSPDLVAVHEAEFFFNLSVDTIRVLSVGTTTSSYSLSHSVDPDFGTADWMQSQRLFSVTIAAQQQFACQLITHRLGRNYVRVDHEPSIEQAKDLGLDKASPSARQALKALGSKAMSDRSIDVKPFISQQAQMRLIKE